MAEISSAANGNGGVAAVDIIDSNQDSDDHCSRCCSLTVSFIQKLIAELLGTYFMILAGCGSVAVNLDKDSVVTLPGIAMVWGLVVMVMIYSVGHISGAHFNPAVSIAFASTNRFPWRQIGELAGITIGSTISINVLFAGPISGASLNPARSLGPAIVSNNYKGIWIYLLGPTGGAIAGAWAYNLIRYTNKPLCEITKVFLGRMEWNDGMHYTRLANN
ncbi:aquaporin NIP1-1-like [Salvia hispanica]|uniref:aquaporin NIP1-1-like n=1 Tax=Salvia hispanica TaxID=49212 RepID=UPI002009032E|nr:aquaporin NIP1-1-like [Salvia hispanica]